MKSKVKITVFTPTYNRGEILINLYHSLQNQNFSDFEWLITPQSNWDGGAFGIYGGGYGGMRYNVYGNYGVRPVVHLRSDIVLTGSGTSSDPYQIVE